MPNTHPIPTFLPETVPVEFISELTGFEVQGDSLLLRCAATRYRPQLHNYYGTRCETLFEPPQPGEAVAVRLDFCTPEIIRIRATPGSDVPPHDTPMVVGRFDAPTPLQLSESESAVTVTTAALRVEIVREPWQLNIFSRAEGRLIFSTRPVDIAPLRRPTEQWNPSQQRWLFLHRYAYPPGHSRHDQRPRVFASFNLRHDEHIYGFGEGYGPLDKRGTRQELWLQEAFSNTSPASYKQTPFYMSTRGYGLFVNTSHALRFNVGSLDHTALSLIVDDTTLLDAYFIFGPSLKEILPRYTAITGRPHVPPKWSFGLWMSRLSYNRQTQVEEVARQLRRQRIPCDVIHIDTDWYERDWVCDLRFGPQKFPDPAAMTARLRDLGFRVSLWQWPNMVIDSPMFAEGKERGFLAKQPTGQPYLFPGFMADAGFIDYSNPAAVAWVQQKFRELFRLGIAAIKVDFGEGAPPDAVYHGVPPEAMHNLYPLLYNRAIFTVTAEFWGEENALVWARSAWAGSQRYPVHWSGDGVSRHEDLACVLRSALSFGLSGFPFYSHDIGGFTGEPDPALYVRWAQLGLFGSHARAHGTSPREPWAYGEQAEALFRRYAELRYRLLPYIYSQAVECGHTSLPLVRALALEFQDDPTTHTLSDQYLFGDSLLIAPVLDEGNRRRLYLPAGEWVDFWSKETFSGGRWLWVDAPLGVLPLFVRGGAMVPFGPPVQHVDELPLDPLTVEIYRPGAAGGFTVREQSRPDIPLAYRREGDSLVVSVGTAPGQVEAVLYGEAVTAASLNGQPLPLTRRDDGGVAVRFDGRAGQSVVFAVDPGVTAV